MAGQEAQLGRRGRLQAAARRGTVRSWSVALFGAVAVLLLPWAATLNLVVPERHVANHWAVTWTGFDLALAAGLLSVAIAAYRRSPWLPRLAMMAGTLLACDAWFDVLTASDGTDVQLAILGAVGAELPLAVLCFVMARKEPGHRPKTELR